jgi:ABC-type dipeptide/oligopeptide/nickel transport system ATPase component
VGEAGAETDDVKRGRGLGLIGEAGSERSVGPAVMALAEPRRPSKMAATTTEVAAQRKLSESERVDRILK